MSTEIATPADRRAALLAKVQKLKKEGGLPPVTAGVQFIACNGNTGDLTYGRDSIPIPAGSEFTVPLEGIRHGYKNWRSKAITEEKMLLLIDGGLPPLPADAVMQGDLPSPRHRDGWGHTISMELFGMDGDLKDIRLSMDFANQSKLAAATELASALLDQAETDDGVRGFYNAVISLSVASYFNKKNDHDVFFPQMTITGWTDGKTIIPAIDDDVAALMS